MKRRRNIIIILILFLTVGFAAVSTTLVITGLVGIGENKDDFNVIFTSAKLDGLIRKDFISDDKQRIEFVSKELKELGESTTLIYNVTNTSRNYDANVTIAFSSDDNEFISFDFQPKEMNVLAGETKTGTLIVSLKKVVNEQKEFHIECKLNANAKKRESLGEEYIEPFSQGGIMMAATNDETEPTGLWAYRDAVLKTTFEDKVIPHETTDDLTFDLSEEHNGSVMGYLVPFVLSDEEKDVKFKELLMVLTGMTEEEYIKNLVERQGNDINTEGSALIELALLKNRFFGLSDKEKNSYFEKYIELELGMTIEEYKKYAVEQGATDEEFDVYIEKIKNEMFPDSGPKYILYIQSITGVKASQNCSSLFSYFSNLLEIEGLEYLDTSNVTDMSSMFKGCTTLLKMNTSNFDTSNVTNMTGMFEGCNNLHNLDVRSFDTRNVTSMERLFYHCSSLMILDVSNFDTAKVINMESMFDGCSSLTSLDLSHFDTSNVENMRCMFFSNGSLIELDLSSFNTNKVIKMGNMFAYCYDLIKIDLRSFDTSGVTDMVAMFNACKSLVNLDISSFDTSSATSLHWMFRDCSSLEIVDFSTFNTSNVTNMEEMFMNCKNLKSLDLSSFDTSKVSCVNKMFAGCTNLTMLDISSFDTSNMSHKYDVFNNMPAEAIIKVKDAKAQNMVLKGYGVECPSSWTTDNVVIRTA